MRADSIIPVMATMIVELCDALEAAGAPEDKAQAAAKALVNTNGRFDHVDRELAEIRGELTTIDNKVTALDGKVTALDVRLARTEAELGMVKWVVGGTAFGVLVQILRSFWPGA